MERSHFFGTFLILSVLFVAGCSGQYDVFAQCLTDSEVKMYGTYWCPYCTEQKSEFGRSWELVDYVECSKPNRGGQTEFCDQADIKAYPTWEFSDGSREEGLMTFDQLAEKTGCSIK